MVSWGIRQLSQAFQVDFKSSDLELCNSQFSLLLTSDHEKKKNYTIRSSPASVGTSQNFQATKEGTHERKLPSKVTKIDYL